MLLEKIWVYAGFILCYFSLWCTILLTVSFHANPLYMIFASGWLLILCILCRFIIGYDHLRPDRLVICILFFVIVCSIIPTMYTNFSLTTVTSSVSSIDQDRNNHTEPENDAVATNQIPTDTIPTDEKYVKDTLAHSRDGLLVGSMAHTHVHVHVSSISLQEIYNQVFPFLLSFATTLDIVYTCILLIVVITSTSWFIYYTSRLFNPNFCVFHRNTSSRHGKDKKSTAPSTENKDVSFIPFFTKKNDDVCRDFYKESIEYITLKRFLPDNSNTKSYSYAKQLKKRLAILCGYLYKHRTLVWYGSPDSSTKTSDAFESFIHSESSLITGNILMQIRTDLLSIFNGYLVIFDHQISKTPFLNHTYIEKQVYNANSDKHPEKNSLKGTLTYITNIRQTATEDHSDLAFLGYSIEMHDILSEPTFDRHDVALLNKSKKHALKKYCEYVCATQDKNIDTKKNKTKHKEKCDELSSTKTLITQKGKARSVLYTLLLVYLLLTLGCITALIFFALPGTLLLPSDLTFSFVWQSIIIRLHLTFSLWLLFIIYNILVNHRIITNSILDFSYTKYKLIFLFMLNKFLESELIKSIYSKHKPIGQDKINGIVDVFTNVLTDITDGCFSEIFHHDVHQFNDGSLDTIVTFKLHTFLLLLPIFFFPLLLKSVFLVLVLWSVVVITMLVFIIIEARGLYTKLNYKDYEDLTAGTKIDLKNKLKRLLMVIIFKSDHRIKHKSKKNKNSTFQFDSNQDEDTDSD